MPGCLLAGLKFSHPALAAFFWWRNNPLGLSCSGAVGIICMRTVWGACLKCSFLSPPLQTFQIGLSEGLAQESAFDKLFKIKFWGNWRTPSYWGVSAHDLPCCETKTFLLLLLLSVPGTIPDIWLQRIRYGLWLQGTSNLLRKHMCIIRCKRAMKEVFKDKMKTKRREQSILPGEQGGYQYFLIWRMHRCSQSRQAGRKVAF